MWLAVGLSMAIAVASLVYATRLSPKTAFVDLTKVYNEFLLKQELEQQLLDLDRSAQYHIDSLEARINVMVEDFGDLSKISKADQEAFQNLQREHAITQQTLKDQKEGMAVEADEKIWRQLNQYVGDFSDKENYDYILGSTGAGNIMGGSDRFNVTDQVIQYVNNRYNGGAK